MAVFIDGADFGDVANFYSERFPQAIKLAQVNAVNNTARKGLAIARERMMKEVRFPDGYLEEPQRFYISQFAQEGLIEAKITARSRSTSLRRFAVGNPTPSSTRGGKGSTATGVQVEIAPGRIVRISSAFVISLNNGNYGVAVKIKNGAVPTFLKKHTFNAAQLGHTYYILYGPSVDQVFRSVANDIRPQIETLLQDEFRAELNKQGK